MAVSEQGAAFAADELVDCRGRLQRALERAEAATPEHDALVEKLGEMAAMRGERDCALEQCGELNRRLEEVTAQGPDLKFVYITAGNVGVVGEGMLCL